MSSSGIRILLASDSDYEQLTADIYWNGDLGCKLNQDRGLSDICLEIFPSAIHKHKISVPLDQLLTAIQSAKEALRTRVRT